jgi:hypothetical protein
MEREFQEVELIKLGEMIGLLNDEIRDALEEIADLIKDFNVDAKLLEKLAKGIDLTNAPHGVTVLTNYEILKAARE